MIKENAIIETDDIGINLSVGEFSIIREGVSLGDNVIIHPHVVINSGSVIGSNVEIFPGTIIGKPPKGAGALARTPEFEEKVQIGENCSIGPNAVIFYDVEIGEFSLIGDGASIRERCKIGSRCIISRYVTINYNSTIGDRTKIMDLSHITGNCTVGDDVFVSVSVSTVNDNIVRGGEYDEARIVGPNIGNGSVIGANAVLLPSVHIGTNAMVGAGSVVTRDVEPNALVLGTPAKFVRYLSD